MAFSRGKIGQIFSQLGRYDESFEHLLFALTTFLQLQSPNANSVANILGELRAKWGEKDFDSAWQEATDEEAPEWFTGESEAVHPE